MEVSQSSDKAGAGMRAGFCLAFTWKLSGPSRRAKSSGHALINSSQPSKEGQPF